MQGDEAEDSKILDAPSGRPQSSGNGAATAAPVAGSTKLKIRFGGSGKSSVHGQNGSLSTPITPIGEPNGAGGLAGEGAASMNVDLAAATAKKEQEAAQAAAEAEAQQAQLKQEAAAREAEEQREKLRAAEEQARQDQVYDAGLRELPQIARQHLVPLHEVVRRAIARSYSELQSLVEVLPGQSDADRKRSIIEYVISTRRQIVKLLVLLRWSKDNTSETERCINLIAFLQRQNYQLERTVNDLKGVRELLNGARVRNYDLSTAVDVLTTGSYNSLPGDLQNVWIPPQKLTASDVLVLLQDLESIIRLRLQLYERIPLQFMQRSYRIHDGRVTFVYPGLFQASFTLGGAEQTDQWYLVDFGFDLKGRDVQQKPSGPMRDHIIQVCNDLLRRHAAPGSEDSSSDPTGNPPDQPLAAEAGALTQATHRGRALVVACTMLEDICLNFQLELWHYHAVQTNSLPTIWQNRLAISLSKDRTTLAVRLLRSDKQKAPPGQPSYFVEESLSISIVQSQQLATSDPNRSLGARGALLRKLAGRLSDVGSAKAETAEQIAGPQRSQERMPVGVHIRQPVFLDAKGKNVMPAPHLRLDMTKTERPVELYKPFLISGHKPRVMLEFDSILGQCFSASTRAAAVPIARA